MVICSQSLYYFFVIIVHSSSVTFKTKLCRMSGLIELAASAGLQFVDPEFWEMPTALKIKLTDES